MRPVVAPEQLGPGRWLLPRLPPSDPAALRRLADDCRELAAVLDGVDRDAVWVLDDLRRGWAGRAADAAPRPLAELRDGLHVVRRALHDVAARLEDLAAAVEDAEQRHGSSWRRVAAVSAVVAVTAAAVVVTVGSAGTASAGAVVAETAVVSAAAGEMAAASAAAAGAESAAAEGLLLAARLARTVAALRELVMPRLVVGALRTSAWAETPAGSAVVGAGATAAYELADSGHVDPADVAFAALLGLSESVVRAPGRSSGYVELTEQRLARRWSPGRRRELIRIARETSPQDVRPFRTTRTQLRSHHRHADTFGLEPRYTAATSSRFDHELRRFVGAPRTVRINGSWKGRPAILYAEYDSQRVVVCWPDGTFRTAFEASPRQHWHLWHDHALGGG